MKKITDKKEYNDFVKNYPNGNALQSWEWGELKEKFGWKTERFGFFENNILIGTVQCLFKKLPFGFKILYIPRGPVINFKNKNDWENFLIEIKKIAKEKKVDLIRIEPEIAEVEIDLNFFKKNNFKKSAISYQPLNTMIVDLKKSEQEIWQKELNQKARYNTRLAERKGVKIIEEGNEKNIKEFYKLWEKTKLRQKISIRSEKYYKELFLIFPKENIHLFLAKYQEKFIAGLIIIFFGKKAIYLYAASDYEFHSLMPTYLVVWKAILKAKEKGCEIFDFWGVAPEGAEKNHPWEGITSFKQKFCNARRINYIGAWDLPMNWKYWIFIWLEKIKNSHKAVKL
ncbi:MAG: peptidoglycan bridge formation glycyltransferase FemA/FemB family protein [Patescibacteria group bacterium]